MIKIYLIIGTGFGLAKINILSVEATRAISDIILTLLMPCLAFSKIVANIEDSDIKNVGIVCLSAVMIFATGLFGAFVVRQTMPVPKQWRGGILAGGMFGNISDLPIAYIQTLDQGLVFTPEEGNKGVANVIIFLTMFLLCLFNLGGFRLIEADFKYQDEESAHTEADNYEPTQQLSIPDENSSSVISSKEANDKVQRPPKTVTRSEELSRSASHEHPPSIASNPTTVASYTSGYNEPDRQPLAYTQNSRTGSVKPRQQSATESIRSIDRREMPPEDVTHLIREYSNVDQYGHRRKSTTTGHTGDEPEEAPAGSTRGQSSMERIRSSTLTRMLTSDATVGREDIEDSGKSLLPNWMRKISITKYFVFFLKNCLRPCSMAVIIALTIAFIPWVKALFVSGSSVPHIAQAPDNQAPLSFIMDYTTYIGAASVPFGLLLLGATLGRLKIKKLHPGFWKSALVLVCLRLCIMPIIGVLWCNRLVRAGWLHYEEDKMLLFVIVIDWALPTMTTIIYFTASYTPPDAKETVQMDCVSFFLMIQYPILAISLPFVASFYIKVKLKA